GGTSSPAGRSEGAWPASEPGPPRPAARPRTASWSQATLSSWFLLEGRADRELQGAEVLALLPIELDSIFHAQRAEGGVPADAGPDAIAEVRDVEGGGEPVDVPDVEKGGDTNPVRQWDDVLRIPQHLAGAARALARLVLGGNFTELEHAQRVGASQV